MSGDNKNEQSVMIPLDELLAQDPSLGSIQQQNPSGQASGVDHQRLERVGLGTQNVGAPLNSVVVPARRAEIKTKRLSSKLLSGFAIIIGIIALVAVGVYIGTLSQQKGAQLTVKQGATPPTKPTQPAPPAKPSAVAVASQPDQTQTAERAPAEKAKPALTPNKSTRTKRRVKSSRRTKSSAKPKVATAPPPPPPPPPPPEKPKASEATALLGSIGKKNKRPQTSESKQSAANSNLPSKLERGQILATLRKNQPLVSRCKSHVTAPTRMKMRVVVAGSGSVKKVSLVSPSELKGSAVEKCVIERVKLYKFPKFGSPEMSLKLPFRLG